MIYSSKNFSVSFIFGIVILLAFFSFAASKEKSKAREVKIVPAEKNNAIESNDKKQKSDAEKVNLTGQSTTVEPKVPSEDVNKIQEDLKQIIVRSQELQAKARDNRSEISQILERAQIHQQILKGITLPKPILSKNQLDQNNILAREKIRLISEQAQQTQQQLKTIQTMRSLKQPESSKIS